jgi:hypothetical protein
VSVWCTLIPSKQTSADNSVDSFLDDIERVAVWDYVPTNGKLSVGMNCWYGLNTAIPSTEDVLRARLKTLGVSEHRFVMEAREWSAWTDKNLLIIL